MNVTITKTIVEPVETIVSTVLESITTTATSSIISEPTLKPNTTYNHPNVKKAKDINNLVMPFLLYFGTGLFLFLGFCFLRNKFKIFYMPRRRLKRCAPPKIPSGFFSWIMVVLRLKTSYVLPIVGVDAEVFLLFLKMAMKLFFTIGIMAFVVLVPVNYKGHANKTSYKEMESLNGTNLWKADQFNKYLDVIILEQITIDNIPEQSPLISFHIVFSWIFSLIVYIFLFKYYNRCRQIRMKYIQNCYNSNYKQLINFRTVMLFGLPSEYRNEEVLYNFFTDLGIGDLENVVICKRYLHLRKALENRQYYLNKIESYYLKWVGYDCDKKKKKKRNNEIDNLDEDDEDDDTNLAFQKMSDLQNTKSGNNKSKKMSEERTITESSLLGSKHSSFNSLNPNHFEPKYDKILLENQKCTKKRKNGRLYPFGDKIDLLNYYIEKFIKWDNNVKKLRKKTNNSTTPVAFVTFKSPLSALIGAQCLLHEKPFTCFVSLATEPRDIYWKNISNRLAHPYTKLMRAICVVLISMIIVIIWFIPVGFISSLVNIQKLVGIFPKLKPLIDSINPFIVSLLDSVFPLIILAVWLSFLPDILTFLSEIQGIETYSWLEQALLKKYFFYQIFNVLFIFSVSSIVLNFTEFFTTNTIMSLWDYVVNKPTDLLKLMATSLTKLSPFYINYIMLQTFFIISIQLIYPAPITKTLLTWIIKFVGFRMTPRGYSNLSDPRVFSLNYGYISTLPLVLFTITLTFSCICPVIPLLGALYFAYSLLVYKYQLMYIQHPRYESYGSFVPLYINRCLFALFIFQFIMFGIISIKLSVENNNNNTSSPNFWGFKTILYMVPLILSTFIVNWWFKQSFEKHFKFIPLEVVSKRLNYDNCIVNSNVTTLGSSTVNKSSLGNEYAYSYCSYCGSHDIISSKVPLNQQRNISNSSLKDISSALRKRPSFERNNSNTDIYGSHNLYERNRNPNNINNSNNNNNNNTASSSNNNNNSNNNTASSSNTNNNNNNNNNYNSSNLSIPTLKYNDRNPFHPEIPNNRTNDDSLVNNNSYNNINSNNNNINNRNINSNATLTTNNNNNKSNLSINKLNYKQNQVKAKSPLGKGKQKSTMLYYDESSSETSNDVTPYNQNSSFSNLSLEPSSSRTNVTQELAKLNTNVRSNYGNIFPSPASCKSTPYSVTTETANLFANSQNIGEISAVDSPRSERPRHYRNRSENNPLIRDKYSSRSWIFDQYTDYQQPRSLRVTGVSDIPCDVYQLNGGYLNINDEQLYCYEHPAVVGPLPSLWLPNKMYTGSKKGEELLEELIKEYKRIHFDDLQVFENDDEDFNNEHIAEEIECDNDHPEWMNNINRKVYHYKKKFNDHYHKSMERYIDYIVQWLNFGLR